jgi:hypothetical protein
MSRPGAAVVAGPGTDARGTAVAVAAAVGAAVGAADRSGACAGAAVSRDGAAVSEGGIGASEPFTTGAIVVESSTGT